MSSYSVDSRRYQSMSLVFLSLHNMMKVAPCMEHRPNSQKVSSQAHHRTNFHHRWINIHSKEKVLNEKLNCAHQECNNIWFRLVYQKTVP